MNVLDKRIKRTFIFKILLLTTAVAQMLFLYAKNSYFSHSNCKKYWTFVLETFFLPVCQKDLILLDPSILAKATT
jgi:hypothetical protein